MESDPGKEAGGLPNEGVNPRHFSVEHLERDPFRVRVIVGVNEPLSPFDLAATLAALETGAQEVFLWELLDVIVEAKRSSSRHTAAGRLLENAMFAAFVDEEVSSNGGRTYRVPSNAFGRGLCRIERIRSGSIEIDYRYIGCFAACCWMLQTTLGHAVKKSLEETEFFNWLVDVLKADVLPKRKVRFVQSFGNSHMELLRNLIETQSNSRPEESVDLVMEELASGEGASPELSPDPPMGP